MPEPYKSMLLPEARLPQSEFETAGDFLLFGYKWEKLPNGCDFWAKVHDNIQKLIDHV